MNTLRFKIMVLLIGAIAIVLLMATLITASVMGTPPNQDLLIDNVAQQVSLVIPLLEQASVDQLMQINDRIAIRRTAGSVDVRSTAGLRSALQNLGILVPVTVIFQPGQFKELLRIDLPHDRLVNLPIAPLVFPASSWLALASWMALVLMGMVLIAVYCAGW